MTERETTAASAETAGAAPESAREWDRAEWVANYFRVSKRTIQRWMTDEAKQFPRPATFGRALMFNIAEVRQWAESHRGAAA